MTPYNDILDKLKDKDFMEWLCELSRDFKIDAEKLIIRHCIGTIERGSQPYKAFLWALESLIFQAWIGWNRKNHGTDNYIECGSDCVNFLFNRDDDYCYYSNYEPGKPLVPELQALIDALWKVWELEKGERNG